MVADRNKEERTDEGKENRIHDDESNEVPGVIDSTEGRDSRNDQNADQKPAVVEPDLDAEYFPQLDLRAHVCIIAARDAESDSVLRFFQIHDDFPRIAGLH